MRPKPTGESEHRVEGALELRGNLDSPQSPRAHGSLLALVLLRSLARLSKSSPSWRLRMRGFFRGIREIFGDFHTTDINFGGGGDDTLLVCSVQRSLIKGQRSRRKGQASAQLLQENHPLAPGRTVRMARGPECFWPRLNVFRGASPVQSFLGVCGV